MLRLGRRHEADLLCFGQRFVRQLELRYLVDETQQRQVIRANDGANRVALIIREDDPRAVANSLVQSVGQPVLDSCLRCLQDKSSKQLLSGSDYQLSGGPDESNPLSRKAS